MRISDWSSDVCSSDLQLAAYNPAVFSGPLAGFLGAMDPDRTLHRTSNWYTTYGGGPTVPNATSNPYYNDLPDRVKLLYTQNPFDDLKAGGSSTTVTLDSGCHDIYCQRDDAGKVWTIREHRGCDQN